MAGQGQRSTKRHDRSPNTRGRNIYLPQDASTKVNNSPKNRIAIRTNQSYFIQAFLVPQTFPLNTPSRPFPKIGALAGTRLHYSIPPGQRWRRRRCCRCTRRARSGPWCIRCRTCWPRGWSRSSASSWKSCIRGRRIAGAPSTPGAPRRRPSCRCCSWSRPRAARAGLREPGMGERDIGERE